SRRRHTRSKRDWSSDVCSSDLGQTDTRLVDAWPAYEAALKAAGVKYEGHIYPGAGHGFNNDATPARYNKAAADQAWKRTIEWFRSEERRVGKEWRARGGPME